MKIEHNLVKTLQEVKEWMKLSDPIKNGSHIRLIEKRLEEYRAILISYYWQLKAKQGDFKGPKWRNFFFGHLHISECNPEGIPTFELLYEFMSEVERWENGLVNYADVPFEEQQPDAQPVDNPVQIRFMVPRID